MLQQLHVQRFKSLQDVSVQLGRLNIVFGPNAAGKSNLLESLVLLSRLVQERTLADAFNGGIRGYPVEAFSFGEGGVEEFMAQDQSTLRIAARLAGSQRGGLDYAVEVGVRPATGELLLRDEHLQRLRKDGTVTGPAAIERLGPTEGHRLSVRRKKSGRPIVEPIGLHHTLASNLQYYGDRYPEFDDLRAEVGTWRVVYLDPREVMRRAQPPREVNDIGERGEHLLPFLHRLGATPAHKRTLGAIIRAVRNVIPSVEDVTTELVSTRGEIDLKVKQGGAWMSARVLSEGTLRVLALCAMAVNPYSRGLIAFEEPENGVHPRRIEAITKILAHAAKDRQVVVTTHSPLVIGEVIRMLQSKSLSTDDVQLLRCSGGADGTEVVPFSSTGALFNDQEINVALIANDDSLKVQAALSRGWLDG
jgi:predicted ATPase